MTSTASAVTDVPAGVHEKITEVVSLLSRALVITLGLLKTLVIVGNDHNDRRTNRIQNLEDLQLPDLELGTGSSMIEAPAPVVIFDNNR